MLNPFPYSPSGNSLCVGVRPNETVGPCTSRCSIRRCKRISVKSFFPSAITGRGTWMQAPHKPPPGPWYKQIATSPGPPRKEALNRSAWVTDPWTLQICSAVHLPLSPKTRTCNLGGQKLPPSKPSPGTPDQPSYLTSCMASSANWVGRFPSGAPRGPLAPRREQSATM